MAEGGLFLLHLPPISRPLSLAPVSPDPSRYFRTFVASRPHCAACIPRLFLGLETRDALSDAIRHSRVYLCSSC